MASSSSSSSSSSFSNDNLTMHPDATKTTSPLPVCADTLHPDSGTLRASNNNTTTAGTLSASMETKTTQVRQLFVGNLPFRMRWQDLKDLFRKAGQVLRADVALNFDNRSKGHGTVLFSTVEDAQAAIDMLHNFKWHGRILEVREDRGYVESLTKKSTQLLDQSLLQQPSLPESPSEPQPKQQQQQQQQQRQQQQHQIEQDVEQVMSKVGQDLYKQENIQPVRQLFVGNLPFHCQWQDIKDLFRGAGKIIRADVAQEQDGKSRGFGTVLFASVEDARKAIELFDGFEFQGRHLRVHFDKFASTTLQRQHHHNYNHSHQYQHQHQRFVPYQLRQEQRADYHAQQAPPSLFRNTEFSDLSDAAVLESLKQTYGNNNGYVAFSMGQPSYFLSPSSRDYSSQMGNNAVEHGGAQYNVIPSSSSPSSSSSPPPQQSVSGLPSNTSPSNYRHQHRQPYYSQQRHNAKMPTNYLGYCPPPASVIPMLSGNYDQDMMKQRSAPSSSSSSSFGVNGFIDSENRLSKDQALPPPSSSSSSSLFMYQNHSHTTNSSYQQWKTPSPTQEKHELHQFENKPTYSSSLPSSTSSPMYQRENNFYDIYSYRQQPQNQNGSGYHFIHQMNGMEGEKSDKTMTTMGHLTDGIQRMGFSDNSSAGLANLGDTESRNDYNGNNTGVWNRLI